jgi:hypothetical protein
VVAISDSSLQGSSSVATIPIELWSQDNLRALLQFSVSRIDKPPSQPKETSSHRQRLRELKLIFKDSPLFTTARRERIADQMEDFYLYLKGIGFEPPKEVPPLGTGPFAASASITPGPAYWGSLIIANKSVDDPLMIHSAYARYACPEILKAFTLTELVNSYRMSASLICNVYYVDSFNNHDPQLLNPKSDTDAWVAALWEIRTACGRGFTDTALLYAIKSFDDEGGVHSASTAKSFSEYFSGRFRSGESVADNQFHNLKTVNDILRKRQLIP